MNLFFAKRRKPCEARNNESAKVQKCKSAKRKCKSVRELCYRKASCACFSCTVYENVVTLHRIREAAKRARSSIFSAHACKARKSIRNFIMERMKIPEAQTCLPNHSN